MNIRKDKKPTELTDEELYALVNELSKIAFIKNESAWALEEPSDCAHTTLYTLYDRSKRGKIGIDEIKQKPMLHFRNILALQCRNNINCQLRNHKVQNTIVNTVSLDKLLGDNLTVSDTKTLVDEKDLIKQADEDMYTKSLLDRFSEESKNDDLSIELIVNNTKYSLSFSYRNIARAYLNLFTDKKVSIKDFENVIVHKETKKSLEYDEIRKILWDFKSYLRKEKILEVK